MIWRLLRLLPVPAASWIPLLLLAVAVFSVGYVRGRTAGTEEWTPVVEDLRRDAQSLRERLALTDRQLAALREAGEAQDAICAEALRQSFLIPEVAALPVMAAPAGEAISAGEPREGHAAEGGSRSAQRAPAGERDAAPSPAAPATDSVFTEFMNAF